MSNVIPFPAAPERIAAKAEPERAPFYASGSGIHYLAIERAISGFRIWPCYYRLPRSHYVCDRMLLWLGLCFSWDVEPRDFEH